MQKLSEGPERLSKVLRDVLKWLTEISVKWLTEISADFSVDSHMLCSVGVSVILFCLFVNNMVARTDIGIIKWGVSQRWVPQCRNGYVPDTYPMRTPALCLDAVPDRTSPPRGRAKQVPFVKLAF